MKLRVNLSKLVKSILPILAVLVCQSCTYNVNISKYPAYSRIIKKDLVTKRPINLYPIDRDLNGSQDRHELGTWMLGVPLIAVIEPGHHLYFDRAIRRDGFNQPGLEDLEGHLIYRGVTYPITYSVGSTADDAARAISLSREFDIVKD